MDNIISGNRKNGDSKRKPGITPIEYWEHPFETSPFFNDIEKILEMPGIDDMAGVLARGNFETKKQRVAAVRLAYKNRKFHDDNHQKMLREFISSGIGMSALGKLLQLQVSTNLMAPSVLRDVLGMKQRKASREDVRRGSDFREKSDIQHREDYSRND